jgi:RNA polymerase sigma-70 factor (ECF subfamily)
LCNKPGREENCRFVVAIPRGRIIPAMSKPTAQRRLGTEPEGVAPHGDVDDFYQEIRQHEAYLHALALRLSGQREIAKDLVQETIARALLHMERFMPGTNLRAWLSTILTRVYLDELKRIKVATRAEPRLTQELYGPIDPTTPSMPDGRLRDALEQLDPDLRTVVELRYLDDLSYKRIADRLGVPIGTVGTRLMRGLAQLRSLLAS